jgi:hypothetical protein
MTEIEAAHPKWATCWHHIGSLPIIYIKLLVRRRNNTERALPGRQQNRASRPQVLGHPCGYGRTRVAMEAGVGAHATFAHMRQGN